MALALSVVFTFIGFGMAAAGGGDVWWIVGALAFALWVLLTTQPTPEDLARQADELGCAHRVGRIVSGWPSREQRVEPMARRRGWTPWLRRRVRG